MQIQILLIKPPYPDDGFSFAFQNIFKGFNV